MANPLISVIIPVYNMAGYLEQTVGSWTHQTLHDIEILMVDDASTDASLEILRKWEDKDKRVHVYHFTDNKSAWSARKLGIEQASGKYIMFADADDIVLPEACEELLREMEKDPVEILHFKADVVNEKNDLPESRIEAMKSFLQPYYGRLEGKDVLNACFKEGKYRFTLWNKMYSTELCKRAFRNQEEAVLPKGQDKLAYFIIAYHAASYRGISSKPYYKYYFGRGGTGIAILTRPQFERICSVALTADKLKEFLTSNGTYKEYEDIEQKFRHELLLDTMNQWTKNVKDEEKGVFFDIILKYWQPEEVITYLSEINRTSKIDLAKQLKSSCSLKYDKHPLKTIATYYHSIVNGGLQRVLCSLIALWVEMGYRVVLITDFPADPNDYEIPEEVERVLVPDYRLIKRENYGERASILSKIMRKYEIDLVVGHAWDLGIFFWDQLLIKAMGAAYIVHCHSVFSLNFHNPWNEQQNIVAPYYLADAVVTLSEVNRQFWKYFNGNVHTVINPFTERFENWPISSCSGHNVLWIGRVAKEKCPYDALDIIQEVIQVVPDTKLHIVGASKIKGYYESFTDEIKRRDLENHVILHGFHKDVRPFYKDASVFLSTSQVEGYPLTFQESMMAGLPIVAYDLPYLTIVKGNDGIITVRQRDKSSAAQKLIELLSDYEKRKKIGMAGRGFVLQFEDYDFEEKWSSIFNSIFEEHERLVTEDEQIMMETLIAHHDIGLQTVRSQPKNQRDYTWRKTVKAAILLVKGKDYIVEHGAMEAIKKAAGKVWNYFHKN